MAVNREAFEYHMKTDEWRRRDLGAASLVSHDVSGTLYIRLDPERSTISVLLDDDDLSAQVDPVTEQITGFQIEDFLREAVPTHPKWLEIAELAGIDCAAIAEHALRGAVLDILFQNVAKALA